MFVLSIVVWTGRNNRKNKLYVEVRAHVLFQIIEKTKQNYKSPKTSRIFFSLYTRIYIEMKNALTLKRQGRALQLCNVTVKVEAVKRNNDILSKNKQSKKSDCCAEHNRLKNEKQNPIAK